MLEDEQYSSDSSDDDYVPDGVDSDVEDLTDESEKVSESEDDTHSNSNVKGKKRGKRKSSKIKKKAKTTEDQENTEVEKAPEENQKERIDNLWASFKEVGSSAIIKPTSPSPKSTPNSSEACSSIEEVKAAASLSSSTSQKVAEKRTQPLLRKGGLSSLTSQLSGKKPKLTTLEKSKLDWDQFKTAEGIAEDLKSFNQGKKGFLERQAFLERADVKQFEIERSLRAGQKK